MGRRITCAATHFPPQAVLERLQAELRPPRSPRWLSSSQALGDPSFAAQMAKAGGVSTATVHPLLSADHRRGVEAVETPGKGGRRQQSLTLEPERVFLQPFLVRAARGELLTATQRGAGV